VLGWCRVVKALGIGPTVLWLHDDALDSGTSKSCIKSSGTTVWVHVTGCGTTGYVGLKLYYSDCCIPGNPQSRQMSYCSSGSCSGATVALSAEHGL